MSTRIKRKTPDLARPGRMSAKGRDIVASLAEAFESERGGLPIQSRFTVRTVEVPHAPLGVRRRRRPRHP